jgi:hypothetical protein
LAGLFENQLIAPARLTAEERQKFFKSQGPKLGVVLTPQGEEKINEIKKVLRSEFDQWRGKQSPVLQFLLARFYSPALKVGQELMRRTESHGES